MYPSNMDVGYSMLDASDASVLSKSILVPREAPNEGMRRGGLGHHCHRYERACLRANMGTARNAATPARPALHLEKALLPYCLPLNPILKLEALKPPGLCEDLSGRSRVSRPRACPHGWEGGHRGCWMHGR